MKLLYDNIIFNLQIAGGISTYWGELIKRHLYNKMEIDFINYNNKNIVSKEINLPYSSILNKDLDFNLIKRFYDIKINQSDSCIFHSSYNRKTNSKVKVVHTVHDFIHEKYYSGPRNWIHKFQKVKSIQSADFIISISENTKKDLLQFHPYLSEEKIKVIYNGVSDDFFPLDQNSKLLEHAPFLLFIGSREEYKNFKFSIELIKYNKNYLLYIVGAPLSEREKKLLNEKIPGRWKSFSKVSNVELNLLYNSAFALIYPSNYEGFGIPILEAMKAGTPVLALNSSSIPEVAGTAGVLIDKTDVYMFSEGLRYIEKNSSQLIKLGFCQAEKFNWDKCYSETMGVYNDLVL
jgi:mannosyltransferase